MNLSELPEVDRSYLRDLLKTLLLATMRIVQMQITALDGDSSLLSSGVENAITGLQGLVSKMNPR